MRWVNYETSKRALQTALLKGPHGSFPKQLDPTVDTKILASLL